MAVGVPGAAFPGPRRAPCPGWEPRWDRAVSVCGTASAGGWGAYRAAELRAATLLAVEVTWV